MRFEVYQKAMRDEANDTRIGKREDIPAYEVPFGERSPFPMVQKYDFDSFEEAKDVMKDTACALDLSYSDYYILKVTADTVEVVYGDPTVDVDGNER